MSESYKEQHPLLYEDLSEEEKFNPEYQWRRPMLFRGRARNSVKGAAAIIRLWPGHWSSSVAYWWIAIGMLALITIIVYNTVVLFTMMPSAHSKETRLRSFNTVNPMLAETQTPVNVYMHLFVDNNNEIDLNNYIPYIDIIAHKYSDLKYHLIIVSDDTHGDTKDMSAIENNDLAFNLLWAKNNVHQSRENNVNIEHVTLSKYMNNSPLQQNWKTLPKLFINFLTRAVSIWDKGGIAFNPDILKPGSPNFIYMEKIQEIFKKFHYSSRNNLNERKLVKKPYRGLKEKVNNIRDIINAMENDDHSLNKMAKNSSEDVKIKQYTKEFNEAYRPVSSPLQTSIDETIYDSKVHPKFSNFTITETIKDYFKSYDSQESLVMAESKLNNVSVQSQKNNDTNTMSLLPMFIKYLFRNKPNLKAHNNKNNNLTTVTRKKKHVLIMDKTGGHHKQTDLSVVGSDRDFNNKYTPVVITKKSVNYVDLENNVGITEVKSEDDNQFALDLKGNIVSSEIPCHAFLGTMFSNAAHHTQESLTDFIITELSIFCKGTLSSCNGIDVIFL